MKDKIKMEWYTSQEPKEKDKVKQLVVNSKPLLDRLGAILAGRVESIRRERLKKDNYDCNYPYLMADFNATERCLNEILNLITIEE